MIGGKMRRNKTTYYGRFLLCKRGKSMRAEKEKECSRKWKTNSVED